MSITTSTMSITYLVMVVTPLMMDFSWQALKNKYFLSPRVGELIQKKTRVATIFQ